MHIDYGFGLQLMNFLQQLLTHRTLIIDFKGWQETPVVIPFARHLTVTEQGRQTGGFRRDQVTVNVYRWPAAITKQRMQCFHSGRLVTVKQGYNHAATRRIPALEQYATGARQNGQKIIDTATQPGPNGFVEIMDQGVLLL